MNWWRAHHGIATDPKYAVAQRYIALQGVTTVTRAEIVSVWLWLLDFCSQNEDRGSIDGVDVAQLSVTLDIPDERVSVIISSLENTGMISDNRLKAWEKRQPKREDDSGPRVEKHREKMKRSVTQGNAQATHGNDVTPPRGRARDLISSSSKSVDTSIPEESSVNRKSNSESDFSNSDWFEKVYSRHPKKKNRNIAAQYLAQVSIVPPEEFDRVHKLWCEEWAKDKPQFAPDLAQWILDQGYRYPPNGNSHTSGNGSGEKAKYTPPPGLITSDVFEKLQRERDERARS